MNRSGRPALQSFPLNDLESVLDNRTLRRLDRWRQARSLFVRPDTVEAERALSDILQRRWLRAQVYGRARRVLTDRLPALLAELSEKLGRAGDHVRVSPEDPQQTKWDAVGNLMPLRLATRQVRALWLLDVLRDGSLYVEFQPIFDLRSGETLGFEGLVRAEAAGGARHMAAEIFPAAVVLGIEAAFERLSWVTVLEAARRLPGESMLFLNVNPQLLIGPDSSLARLGEEAERMDFPYTRLALDLVEIERIESLERLQHALAVPHDLGVAIALDDVTSGYGTLRYCSDLAPRWIKVDSEITRRIGADPPRRAILQLLAQVARESRVGLIAEGIESAEDLDVCVAEGVFAAQGYFLARPSVSPGAASDEFGAWLAARRESPVENVAAPSAAAAAPDPADDF
jgi:EAL domain-containing protein (putative c-di-GMP-specific phosphodiesterase class I)